MPITVEKKGFKQVDSLVKRTPKLIRRARKSATSACSNYVKVELQNHIEFGGVPVDLHPLTKNLTFSSKTGKWRKRSAALAPVPFYKLGRLAGYFVNKDGSYSRTAYGVSKRGGSQKVNKPLLNLIAKHQKGFNKNITPRIRRIINKGLIRLGKKPLRKSTQTLKIPARNIVEPVLRKVRSIVPKLYDKRFGNAISRYLTGKPAKTSRIGL